MSKKFFIIYDVTFGRDVSKEEVEKYAREMAEYINAEAEFDGASTKWELDAAGPLYSPGQEYKDSKTVARVQKFIKAGDNRTLAERGSVEPINGPELTQEELKEIAGTQRHLSHCPNSGPSRKNKKYYPCGCPLWHETTGTRITRGAGVTIKWPRKKGHKEG